MRRADALAILAAHKDELARFHVRSLALFGSVARDESGPDRSVDVLDEFHETPGLIGFMQLEHYLCNLLGARVDLVMRAALKPAIGQRVLREAVAV